MNFSSNRKKKKLINSNTSDKSLLVKSLDVTIDDTTAKLVHLGLRRNKKRAHLLVSNILGKHIPVNPYQTALSGAVLGAKLWNNYMSENHEGSNNSVSDSLIDEGIEVLFDGVKSGMVADEAETILSLIEVELDNLINSEYSVSHNINFSTVGFAETATGLGANVAHILQSEYNHSTRDWAGREKFLSFEEEHSHATSHGLVDIGSDSNILSADVPLVLVDDEFSTGKTLMNIITELHQITPERRSYYVVSLIDCRGSSFRQEMDDLAEQLNISIRPITLVDGQVNLPDNILDTVSMMESDQLFELLPEHVEGEVNKLVYQTGLTKSQLTDNKPINHEELYLSIREIEESLKTIGKSFADTLVLGREEFMYYPQRVAQYFKFHFSSTTRSPIMVFDREDYPVKSGVKFVMDDGSNRFAYNVSGFKNVILFQDENLSDDEAQHMANSLQSVVPYVMVFKPEHS